MEKEMVWGPQMFKDHFEKTTNNSIILSALEDRKFKFYLNELQLTKTDVFLDAGCGYGRLAKAIDGSVQHIIGIDINPDNVEFSKKYVGSGFEGHVVDLSKGILPFEDKSIDKVVFDNVLMFFDEKTQVSIFKEVKRVLKNSGKLAFNFENSDYTFNSLALFFITLYKFKAKLQGKATPVHHKYSLEFYEKLLSDLGFGKDIKSIGGTFYKKMGFGPLEVLPGFVHSYIAKLDVKHYNAPKKQKMAGITVAVSAE